MAMKRWLLITLQVLSVGLLALIIVWGGPEAWKQVSSGDRTFILISFMLLGLASMVSAVRIQLIARSTTGKSLAPWTRFYNMNMTIRALWLIVPRSLSTLGGKSVALSTIGISLRRAVWIVFIDNVFDLILLGVLVGPALLYLRRHFQAWGFLTLISVLILGLAVILWGLRGSGYMHLVVSWIKSRPRISTPLGIDPDAVANLSLSRSATMRAFGLSVLLNGLLATCFFYIAQAVGLTYPLFVFIAGFPITQLSLILAVTPGGLGLFDAGWYGVLLLAGVPNQQALTFVIAQRAYIMIYVLIWAGFSVLLSLAATRVKGL